MKTCFSYRCAVTYHQGSATHLRAKCSPQFSAALQNRLTTCLCHHRYTYEDLLFKKVCSDPTPGLCSTSQGNMQPPVTCAAVQNRLTACACHHRHTYEDLVLKQVCTDPPPGLCNTALGKLQSSVLLCRTGSQHAWVTTDTPMKTCSSYRCALTQHQGSAALLSAKCNPHYSVLLCRQQAHNMLVSPQIHL